MLSQVLINVVCLRFAAVAENCDHDLTSALQTHSQAVRHSAADASASQVDRAHQAIANAATDAEFICVSAEAGEEAPFRGTFTPTSGQKVEVDAGHTASESGEYCVSNSLASLMQRATLDGQATNFEAVVADKNTEGSTGGKNQRRRRTPPREVCTENCCGGASNRCKAYVKSELRSGGDVCSSKRNVAELESIAPIMGCTNVSQVDTVCQSDCKLTCDELVSGQIQLSKQSRDFLIASTPPGQDISDILAVMPTASQMYCCHPDGSGRCPERPPTQTQAGVWDSLSQQFNSQFKLKDVCTPAVMEAKCATL